MIGFRNWACAAIGLAAFGQVIAITPEYVLHLDWDGNKELTNNRQMLGAPRRSEAIPNRAGVCPPRTRKTPLIL
jgi:hypothetical protein